MNEKDIDKINKYLHGDEKLKMVLGFDVFKYLDWYEKTFFESSDRIIFKEVRGGFGEILKIKIFSKKQFLKLREILENRISKDRDSIQKALNENPLSKELVLRKKQKLHLTSIPIKILNWCSELKPISHDKKDLDLVIAAFCNIEKVKWIDQQIKILENPEPMEDVEETDNQKWNKNEVFALLNEIGFFDFTLSNHHGAKTELAKLLSVITGFSLNSCKNSITAIVENKTKNKSYPSKEQRKKATNLYDELGLTKAKIKISLDKITPK